MATALDGARFLCFFRYFVYIAHFTKFTRRSSLLMNKLFTCRKIKSRRKSLVKERKKKENRSKEERKRIPFVKRLVLAEVHAGAQIWTKKSPRIIILKAVCRFVALLLSTFYSFSIFAAGFTFAFLQLCPLLCRPPQRSNERSR